MKPTLARLLALGAALILPATATAQDHAHGPGQGHQLGRVTFAVSCNAEAQQRFEYAMAGLHSFWWEEGDRAFSAVIAADSTCAMGYWGLALNAWGNPFAGGTRGEGLRRGAAAAERGLALDAPTARERGFLAAAGALYRDHATVPNQQRLRAYADTLERLYADFPDDPEVAIYHALGLIATAARTDTTFAQQKRAAAILNPLFERFPDHPGLAHYIIHANDSPGLAQLGVAAARRYAEIAPAAPHAQHMPSHIFIRLGLWDDNIAANQRSFDAGVAYARAQSQPVVPEQYHAVDYMVYGYLQQGRDAAARAKVAGALALTAAATSDVLLANYNRTAMEARIPLERGEWAAAARLPLRAGQPGISAALTRFARGIGAARSGDTAQARAELEELAQIEAELTRREDPDWPRVVGIKRQAVSAWLALARRDTADALRLAAEAAELEDVTEKHPVTPGELLPARELQGDLLFAVGRYREALAAYEATLRREPGRARSIYGAARAAQLAGDRAAARARFDEFLKQMEQGDGNRAEILVARAALR